VLLLSPCARVVLLFTMACACAPARVRAQVQPWLVNLTTVARIGYYDEQFSPQSCEGWFQLLSVLTPRLLSNRR